MTKLLLQTLATFVGGALLLGLLLFLPAGTFNYWQAWVFIVVFMITISIFGVYFSIKDPALIERRKQAGPAAEQSTLQKIVATIAFTGLFALFVLSALDRRFGWSQVPPLVSWIGDALLVLSFIITMPVLVIRILDEEKVLAKDLPGYTAYEQKVRYRLVPYLW